MDPVAAFVADCRLDAKAEAALRKLPPDLQMKVMSQGPPSGDVNNNSGVIMSRIRDVENPPARSDRERERGRGQRGGADSTPPSRPTKEGGGGRAAGGERKKGSRSRSR